MAKRKYAKENNLVKAINTDSLELQKPLVNEYYDINVHNSNMDKIDLAIKQNKNNISENKTSILSIKNLENEEVEVRKIETEENFIAVEDTKNGYFTDIKLEGKTLVVNKNNEVVEAGTSGATIKSVGQDVSEISVLTQNNEETKEDKKRILYYNSDTKAWEKPVLREWDTIEKHSDGKYYYHKRSGEVTLNGSESWGWAKSTSTHGLYAIKGDSRFVNGNVICDKFGNIVDDSKEYISIVGNHLWLNKASITSTDPSYIKAWLQSNPVTVVYQLAEEKVYECTNLDLISYQDETNYMVNTGAITPKSSFDVAGGISNVVKLLQQRTASSTYSLLEEQVATLETQATENEKKISILESENKELREELTQIQTSIASLISILSEK